MLEIHPQLLLYQGAIFLIFVFLMWRFVYRKIVKAVEDRRQRIEDAILEAERQRGEAEALRLGYEGRLNELNAQAAEILRKAENQGWQKYDEIMAAARAEAARFTEQQRRLTRREIEETVLAARDQVVELAAAMARKALGRAVNPELDQRLIQELTRELEHQQWKG